MIAYPSNPPDACRKMAEQIWEHIDNKQIAIHPDTIGVIAEAIRDHTAYPEMVEFLSSKENSYGFDRLDRVKTKELLAKAGVKP